MNTVFRQEHKYLITLSDYKKYSHRFEQMLVQDVNNGIDGYPIRSLYFDSLNNQDFYQKEEGLEVRKKIRLRIYDTESKVAKLEMKQKQGKEQLKRSLMITREDAVLLSQGIYTPLLNYSEPFAAECFAVMNMEGYRPKTIVEYNRKAFIAKENKIRITFDTNIRVTESCMDLFSDQLCMYPVFDHFNVVLEVKYNGFLLSYIKDVINEIDKSPISVSKYCLGRSISMGYTF